MNKKFLGQLISGLLLLLLPLVTVAGVTLQPRDGGASVAVSPGDTAEFRVSYDGFTRSSDIPDRERTTRFFAYRYFPNTEDVEDVPFNAVGAGIVSGCTASGSQFSGSFFECERTGEDIQFEFSALWNESEDSRIYVAVEHFYTAPTAFSAALIYGTFEVSDESNDVDVLINQAGFVVFQDDNDPTFSEGDGVVSVLVERIEGTDGVVEIEVLLSESSSATTADLDADLELLTPSLTWADGESGAKEIQIRLIQDTLAETLESFDIELLGEADGFKTVFIRNSAQLGTAVFKTTSSRVSEDVGTVDVQLAREGGFEGALSASVSVASGGTAIEGQDYRFATQTVNWVEGDISDKLITFTVLTDDIVENDERFSLVIEQTPAANSDAGAFRADFVIADTTVVVEPIVGTAAFDSSTLNIQEGASRAVVVNRVGGSGGVLTIDLSVLAASTAQRAVDFEFSPESLTWGDGDNEPKEIQISILSDTLVEGRESFSLQLENEDNTTSSLEVLITDAVVLVDDPATNTVIVVSGNEQTGGVEATELEPFVVRAVDADGVPLEDIQINWAVSPEEAGSFSAGDNSSTGADGETSNVFTIESRGAIVVTASLDDVGNAGTASASSGQLVRFTFDGGLAGLPELDEAQRTFARGVDNACQRLNDEATLSAQAADLLSFCDALDVSADIDSDLSLLAFEEIATQGRLILDTANFRINNVRQRLRQIRRGDQGIDLSGIDVNLWNKKLPNSVVAAMSDSFGLMQASGGGDAFVSPWGGFINASIGVGEKDSTSREIGFDFNVQDFSIGADYRVSSQTAIGAGVSWMGSDTDFNNSAGNLDSDSVGLILYATRYLSDRMYLDGILSFSNRDFDIRRNLIGNNNAIGSTTGSDFSLGVNGGYEYQRGKHTFSPFFRLLYTSATVDAYTEQATSVNLSGSGTILNIAKQDIDNSSLILGGEWLTTISTENGVFRPSARIELEHRLDDKARDVTADFVHDPGHNTLTVLLDEPDTDFANLGFGVSAVFENGKSGALSYETQLGREGVKQHWLKLNWRWEF